MQKGFHGLYTFSLSNLLNIEFPKNALIDIAIVKQIVFLNYSIHPLSNKTWSVQLTMSATRLSSEYLQVGGSLYTSNVDMFTEV